MRFFALYRNLLVLTSLSIHATPVYQTFYTTNQEEWVLSYSKNDLEFPAFHTLPTNWLFHIHSSPTKTEQNTILEAFGISDKDVPIEYLKEIPQHEHRTVAIVGPTFIEGSSFYIVYSQTHVHQHNAYALLVAFTEDATKANDIAKLLLLIEPKPDYMLLSVGHYQVQFPYTYSGSTQVKETAFPSSKESFWLSTKGLTTIVSALFGTSFLLYRYKPWNSVYFAPLCAVSAIFLLHLRMLYQPVRPGAGCPFFKK